MLELTLATDFIPGSNLRGNVAGANWTYLLPDLNLEAMLCVGAPSTAALHTLASLAQSVIVCTPSHASLDTRALAGWPNVTLLAIASNGTLPLDDLSVDLVFVTDRHLVRDHRQLENEIRRVLRPRGLAYYETRSPLRRMPSADNLLGSGSAQHFWLTPLGGEMHTAVPASDAVTRRFFLRQALFSPSITVHTAKRAIRRMRRRRQTVASPDTPPSPPEDRAPQRLGDRMRLLGDRVFEALASAEGTLHRHTTLIGRYGVLEGRAGAPLTGDPPAYLCDMAEQAGLDLHQYGWGLWAGGQYSSRKLLFFLVDRESASLRYLVKMVRDPSFNTRLENECAALKDLEARNFAHDHALPRVVFHGHHHHLAIVGETAVQGVPFKSKTRLTASCPYAHAVIEWLTDLGATTASPDDVAPQDVARALNTLFERFQAIYRLPPAERDFLSEQIAALGNSRTPFPLVFQHGDPGPWNMLVTPDDTVALLDWESAEPKGIPLWDLFYFLRSYAVNVARANGTADRVEGFAKHFLTRSSLNHMIVDATRQYCTRIGLAGEFIGPLFYTCWMHRALKQSTLLQSHTLADGYYFRLLRYTIQQHDAPALRQLFTQT